MMMLRLFRRNPSHLPLLYLNQIRNGTAFNPQTHLSPFTLFFSSASDLPHESESLEAKDPIFDFFRSYGFSDTQMKRFIHKSWSVRSTELMKPKLKYLLAFGFSPSDLIVIICANSNILRTSLKKRIEPNLKLLEATFGPKTNIIKTIKRGPWLLTQNLEKRVIPNIKILRENSIPTDTINRLFMAYPRVLLKDTNEIIETISTLKGLGMNPSTLAFTHGMNLILVLKKETWERKMELYRSLGWSEKTTLSVFSRQPTFLGQSDENAKKKMKFFKEKLQWDSAMLAKRPIALMLSLEGRIIPRCAVINVLAKRKLWEGKPNLYTLFQMVEKNFKERFVDEYEKEVPQVIDAYQGKIDFVGFESIGG